MPEFSRNFLRFALCYSLFILTASANPTGGSVAAGSATIQTVPGVVTVNQTGNQAIINWNGFSINQGELTKFNQPGSQSAVLNRVTGGDPSQLLGSLQSNGKVFLINPNGILVGAGARIDTSGFIASTLDVTDQQFLSGGNLKFAGNSNAKVTNLGTIKAERGDILMIAANVENAGTLEAPNGTAALVAGHQVVLKRQGSDRFYITPGDAGQVSNSGTIAAIQAELKANGGHMESLAVNNSGIIKATGVKNQNGRILLVGDGGTVTNTGKLIAKNSDGAGGSVTINAGAHGKTVQSGRIDVAGAIGKMGGKAEVLGNAINVKASSVIDASGGTGGGTILVGGGAKGSDASIPNAKTVAVERGASFQASAIEEGKGGQVVAWSDQTMNFAGDITARGGNAGGDGGMAEVSGKQSLAYHGTADLGANGRIGTLQLDPASIIIHEGSGSDSSTDVYQDTLQSQNANVVLTADNSISAVANNPANPFTITLQANLSFAATVTGMGSIDLTQANIVTSGTGGITLTAATAGSTVSVNQLTAGGPLAITAGPASGGSGSTVNLSGNLGSGGSTTIAVDGGNGTIGLNADIALAAAGQVDLKGTINSTTRTLQIGTLANPAGDVVLEKNVQVKALTIYGANITTDRDVFVFGDAALHAGAGDTTDLRGIFYVGNNTLTLETDRLTLDTTGNSYYGDAVSSATGTLNLLPATSGADMTVGGAKSNTSLSLSTTDLGNVHFGVMNLGISGQGDIALNSASLTHSVVHVYGATQTLNNTSFTTEAVEFQSGGVTLLNGFDLISTVGGSATFDSPLGLAPNASVQVSTNSGGAQTGGAISFNNTIDGSGDLILVAGGGLVGFNSPIGGTTQLADLSIYAPNVSVLLPAIQVSGTLTVRGDFSAATPNATSISQSGAIGAHQVTAYSSGTIDLSNAGNQIEQLGTVNFGSNFHINDTVDLNVVGHVTGAASSTATLEVHGGVLNLEPAGGSNAGAQITIGGSGNSLQLAADGGVFNDVGSPSVLNMQNGARWVIYVTANDSSHLLLGGLSPAFTTSAVAFPTLPPNSGNGLVIGPVGTGGGGGPTTTGVYMINIVAGASAVDDSQLDDGQILFGDAANGTTLTISQGKLDSLSGNVTLQAVHGISLASGVDIDFAQSGLGSLISFQTGGANDSLLTLGGNLISVGGSLDLTSGLGNLSLHSLDAGAGNITLTAGALTLDATTTLHAASLAITAGNGIGTSANPLHTSVSVLDAKTSTAGIFIANSGAVLNLGGFNSNIAGIIAGAGNISITNDHTINITDSTDTAKVSASGNITIEADGASSDLITGNGGVAVTALNNHSATLQAGRDLNIGNGSTSKSGGVTAGNVFLNAGHAVVFDEGSSVIGDNGVAITAGTVVATPDSRPSAILFRASHTAGARAATRGGNLTLTTASMGFVDLRSGTTSPVLLTTLSAGSSAPIVITTDDLNLASQISAGSTSPVNLVSARTGETFDIGTDHPANTVAYPAPLGYASFNLTNAELNEITASQVNIGSIANSNNILVSAPIHVTSTYFLNLQGVQIDVPSSINSPGLGLVSRDSLFDPGSALTTTSLHLQSVNGSITVDAPIVTNGLFMDAGTTITLDSLDNRIGALGNINHGADVIIRDGQSINLAGNVASSNSNVTIRTTGDITLNANSQVSIFSGHTLTLEAANGHFVNNAGSNAIVLSGGSRFRIYSQDRLAPFNAGGLTGAPDNAVLYTTANATFGSDPDTAHSVFYFQNVNAQPPSAASGSASASNPSGAVAQSGNNTLTASSNTLAANTSASTLAAATQQQAAGQAEVVSLAEQQRIARLSQWPPVGTIQMSDHDIVAFTENYFKTEDDQGFDTKLFNTIKSTDHGDALIDDIIQLDKKTEAGQLTVAQSRVSSVLKAEGSLVFTSESAIDQYLEDRGDGTFGMKDRMIMLSEGPSTLLYDSGHGQTIYQDSDSGLFFLYVGDGSPLGRPYPLPPPPPAPAPVAPKQVASTDTGSVIYSVGGTSSPTAGVSAASLDLRWFGDGPFDKDGWPIAK